MNENYNKQLVKKCRHVCLVEEVDAFALVEEDRVVYFVERQRAFKATEGHRLKNIQSFTAHFINLAV